MNKKIISRSLLTDEIETIKNDRYLRIVHIRGVKITKIRPPRFFWECGFQCSQLGASPNHFVKMVTWSDTYMKFIQVPIPKHSIRYLVQTKFMDRVIGGLIVVGPQTALIDYKLNFFGQDHLLILFDITRLMHYQCCLYLPSKQDEPILLLLDQQTRLQLAAVQPKIS